MLSNLVLIPSTEAALKQCIAYTVLESPFFCAMVVAFPLYERLGVVSSLLTVNGDDWSLTWCIEVVFAHWKKKQPYAMIEI